MCNIKYVNAANLSIIYGVAQCHSRLPWFALLEECLADAYEVECVVVRVGDVFTP